MTYSIIKTENHPDNSSRHQAGIRRLGSSGALLLREVQAPEVKQGLIRVMASESFPDIWTFSKECLIFWFTVSWTDELTLGDDGVAGEVDITLSQRSRCGSTVARASTQHGATILSQPGANIRFSLSQGLVISVP